MTYEAVAQTTAAGLGQSTCVGIGGDPVKGTDFIEILEMFLADPGNQADRDDRRDRRPKRNPGGRVPCIGNKVKKPTVGFIAGATAPPGRRMGHAGAVISGGRDTAAAKFEAMRLAGIHIAESPAALGSTLVKALAG